MPAPLKLFFNAVRVAQLADDLHAAWPDFPRAAFQRDATHGLDDLELMDRGAHIARALRAHLPADYDEAVAVLLASVRPATGDDEAGGLAPFYFLPHLRFVADHGREHFETSMRAQHALTQRFSAEFSVRVFLEHEPERTLARLAEWVTDPNPHVRRLVSEGTRPRLPWASRLPRFQRDPTPTLALLERLKDDPELYVRRSVANHLNDIGKDHPELLLEVAERWSRDATPERRWIVAHALRSAVKKGDARALAVRGFQGGEALVVAGTVAPTAIPLGASFQIGVDVTNSGDDAVNVVVDLAVHFVKASGQARPKVFKGRDLRLAAGATARVTKTVSTVDLSTRRHHAGPHAVEVRVNGRVVPIGVVEVSAAP